MSQPALASGNAAHGPALASGRAREKPALASGIVTFGPCLDVTVFLPEDDLDVHLQKTRFMRYSICQTVMCEYDVCKTKKQKHVFSSPKITITVFCVGRPHYCSSQLSETALFHPQHRPTPAAAVAVLSSASQFDKVLSRSCLSADYCGTGVGLFSFLVLVPARASTAYCNFQLFSLGTETNPWVWSSQLPE